MISSELRKIQKLALWQSRKIFYTFTKQNQQKWTVKRGEVYFADLGENIGSEESKTRPVVVIQANTHNFRSPVFTCAIISSSPVTIPDIQIPITGQYAYNDKAGNHCLLSGAIDLGQMKTLGKERIVSKKICTLAAEMADVDIKLLNIFGLTPLLSKRDNIIASLQGKVTFLQEKLQKLQEEQQELKKKLQEKDIEKSPEAVDKNS